MCVSTSSSLRMLHGRGVTLAGLDWGIFCLISSAAASSLSAFRLEITTLQPEDEGRCCQLWSCHYWLIQLEIFIRNKSWLLFIQCKVKVTDWFTSGSATWHLLLQAVCYFILTAVIMCLHYIYISSQTSFKVVCVKDHLSLGCFVLLTKGSPPTLTPDHSPSSSSSAEIALPIPVPPPVTIATLWLNKPGLKTLDAAIVAFYWSFGFLLFALNLCWQIIAGDATAPFRYVCSGHQQFELLQFRIQYNNTDMQYVCWILNKNWKMQGICRTVYFPSLDFGRCCPAAVYTTIQLW